MSAENDKLSQLQERIAVTENTAKAAHARIDQMDKMMRDDLKEMKAEIKEDIKSITDDMKIVLAFLERWKGMIVVITFVAGVLGWIIQQVFGVLFHK